jgi:TonB-linked SusC/RagA family outer membrane protein
MKRFVFAWSILWFVGINLLQAQGVQVSGKVTSAVDGSALPGVSVVVRGSTIGSVTDFEGNYSITIPDGSATLMFSFVGMLTREVSVDGKTTINVVLESSSIALDEVVVTALGISRESKSLGFAVQDVDAEEMNVTSGSNIKSALVGKVAGVQHVGQAGSKLGEAGRIRIRGAVSMSSDGDPLYVLDGIPVNDPNVIDMENVDNVSVLKGPNATALYGQRAEYGVIMITTKKAPGKGVHVELNSNTTFEKVAYLPNYQNQYGAGYDGKDEWVVFDYAAGNPLTGAPWPEEFAPFDGQKYIFRGDADESWGPKMDGSQYVAWYNWWPDSPYYGQTSTFSPQPDNIKDFWDTGVTLKNTVAISGNGDTYNARVAYTNLDQKGLQPYTTLKKNMVNAVLSFDATKRLTLSGNLTFSNQVVNGAMLDYYANPTSGAFNQWFNRNIDMGKMKELQDLTTTHGYHASWNYWNPSLGEYLGTEKPAYWYNPYFLLKHIKLEDENNYVLGKVDIDYRVFDGLTLNFNMTTNVRNFRRRYELPEIVANSASPDLSNVVTSGFGNTKSTWVENNYNAAIRFDRTYGELNVRAMAGGNLRTNSDNEFFAYMNTGSKTQGLILPDVFTYSNAKLPVTPETYFANKKVYSLYANASIGYRSMLFLDLTGRQDWSSALPANNNGYFYPSVGGSFVFSELIDAGFLTFGKIRAGWAQVGNDVAALALNPSYPLSSSPYFGLPQMYNNTQSIDPNISPSLNTSFEAGFDVNFLRDRVGISFTYFNETRTDEIIPVDMSSSTGYDNYLTNAGSARRTGFEVTLNANPVRSDVVDWNIYFNIGTSNTIILELPGDLQSMDGPGGGSQWGFVSVTHELNNKWGQLRGRDIATDDDGNEVINAATGTYAYETGQYMGSILPDYTGGLLNELTLFNLVTIIAAIDFQKGGTFFSLSESWGWYSGLYEETAGTNDRGGLVRDDPADGGGVHVTGVDTEGNAYDDYVDSNTYFSQHFSNTIATKFIHEASFIKLRELGVSLNLPPSLLGATFIKGASIGFVGRNLWLRTSKDNVHGWDPSELSGSWGENGQLPGTRSFGFNVRLAF